MRLSATRLLALALLFLAGLGVSSILPAHATGDFTLTNKFVVNGVVTSNLGIANGGIAKGQIEADNVVSGTPNSIVFSFTTNGTGTDFPNATFHNPTLTLGPTNSLNTTMEVGVDANVPHGAYRLTVNATSGICPGSCFTHLLSYDIKVYSIAVTIDAQSTSGSDITPSPSASQAASFRVGVMVANATTTGGTSPVCTVAFPCGLSLYGWAFSLTYDSTILIPQGDPSPLATPGNLAGLYVDSAQGVALYGTQTNIGEGSSNWASIIAANNAFTVTEFLPNKIIVGLTLKAPLSPAFLASANGRFLLANVGFELLQHPSSPSLVNIDPSDFGFGSQLGQPECICIISTAANQGGSASETITNTPPTASFTATPLPVGDASCSAVYSADTTGCSAYAFRFDASASSDDVGVTSYVWDFGDGSRDSAAEATATCPAPDADLNCSQGAIAIHDYGAVAANGGSPVPGSFSATLRVADASGATGSARDLSGNPIPNSQPSHETLTQDVVAANLAPTLSISPSASPTAGQTFTISITASDPDGSVASVKIDWGDGTTPTNVTGNPSSEIHTYANSGTFTVTVTVTDNAGKTTSKTSTVIVAAGGSTLLSGPVLYGIIGAILVAVIALVLLMRRRSRPQPGSVAATK